MRGLVVFLLLAIIISLSFVAAAINKDNKKGEPAKTFEFSTFTSAVCEDSEDFIKCEDKLFVNCDGRITRADDIVECGGIKLDSQKVAGFAVFSKEWKDPRI